MQNLPPPDTAQKVLDAHEDELKIVGVTKAYVGWVFRDNWITADRAIVVLTVTKEARDEVEKELANSLEGIPIQVRKDPRPPRKKKDVDLTELSEPFAYDERFVRPEFPGEKVFDQRLSNTSYLAKAPARPPVQYEMPKNVDVNPGPTKMDLILHVSPEQGWAQLKLFLEQIDGDLTVGMYELTAPHIEKTLIEGLGKQSKLVMTLDSPPEKKDKREQTVEDVQADIESALGKERFDFAWALSGQGTEAPAREFATSYHIKVAVTGNRFWLSSGNWNTSNQPDVNPEDDAVLKEAAHKRDRDWHVICTSAVHAEIFRKYLKKDHELASKTATQGLTNSAFRRFSPTPILEDVELDASAPVQFFSPCIISDEEVQVRALFTPQQYRGPVIDLIDSAKETFYMQTQYIHPSDPTQEKLTQGETHRHCELLEALVKATERGVDVKVITSDYQDHSWIEKLQDTGFYCVDLLKIQPHVHNKGMVVDGKAVVVSSQNWSPDGTGPNRDAGLIIYSAKAAKYFGEIFGHDWKHMAHYKAFR